MCLTCLFILASHKTLTFSASTAWPKIKNDQWWSREPGTSFKPYLPLPYPHLWLLTCLRVVVLNIACFFFFFLPNKWCLTPKQQAHWALFCQPLPPFGGVPHTDNFFFFFWFILFYFFFVYFIIIFVLFCCFVLLFVLFCFFLFCFVLFCFFFKVMCALRIVKTYPTWESKVELPLWLL